MAKQTKPPTPHNRVIAFITHGKNLRMIEAKELDWQQIFAGEGIGNGKQKKDVAIAFYLNANDDVIMKWEKPVQYDVLTGQRLINPPQKGTIPILGNPNLPESIKEFDKKVKAAVQIASANPIVIEDDEGCEIEEDSPWDTIDVDVVV